MQEAAPFVVERGVDGCLVLQQREHLLDDQAGGVLARQLATFAPGLVEGGVEGVHQPLVARSYAEAVPVLRIDDLEADGRGALFVTLTVFAPPPRANLLHDGGFERGTAKRSDSWQTDAWLPSSSFFRDRWRPYQGRFAASIKSTVDNDARWVQTVDGLDAGAPYLLCGALRGRDISRGVGVEVGGNLSVLGMPWFERSEDLLYGFFGWRRVCYPFRAPSTTVTVACRLGFYSSLARGQLWCDDLSLERIEPAFASQ